MLQCFICHGRNLKFRDLWGYLGTSRMCCGWICCIGVICCQKEWIAPPETLFLCVSLSLCVCILLTGACKSISLLSALWGLCLFFVYKVKFRLLLYCDRHCPLYLFFPASVPDASCLWFTFCPLYCPANYRQSWVLRKISPFLACVCVLFFHLVHLMNCWKWRGKETRYFASCHSHISMVFKQPGVGRERYSGFVECAKH